MPWGAKSSTERETDIKEQKKGKKGFLYQEDKSEGQEADIGQLKDDNKLKTDT